MKEYKYKINGNNYSVSIGDVDDNKVEVLVNGVPYKVEMEKKPEAPVAVKRPAAAPRTATGEKIVSKPAPAAGGFTVKAPLPGTVLSIPVKVGDTVKASDPVVILEAMKMENSVNAGRDGRVASIAVNPGDAVLEGAPLVTLE